MSTPSIKDRLLAPPLLSLAAYPLVATCNVAKECLVRALTKLGFFLYWNGDYSYADMAYDASLKLKPRDTFSTMMRVQLLGYLENSDQLKIAILEDYLREFPDSLGPHLALSSVLMMGGEIERAKNELEVASKLSPGDRGVRMGYARLHRYIGQLKESTSILESLAADGEPGDALCLLADNKIDEGEPVEAIKLLNRAIEHNPSFPAAHTTLASCRYYDTISHPHIVRMKRIVEEAKLPAIHLSQFHFALGEAFDGMDIPDEAFAHFRAGNELAPHLRYPTVKQFVNEINSHIRMFDRHFLNSLHISTSQELVGKSLIFVVGMPRSGTTLVEQILSSHPEVYGGGERNDIGMLLQKMCLRAGPCLHDLTKLDQDTVSDLVREYASRICSESQGYTYFVDKSLGNTFEIGFLRTFFPWAKIVYCRRNPLDSCLSCYFKNLCFVFYSRDLKSIGAIYAAHERIMDHWHSLFGDQILTMDYENLVSHPEVHIERLLKYCGLSWKHDCLNPERTTRVVRTASAPQVKVPINTRAVGRWKKYHRYLGPLMEGLASSPNKATSHWWREYELYRHTIGTSAVCVDDSSAGVGHGLA